MIERPMDLGTVKARLEALQYATIDDWICDMRLIWSNACEYNGDDHEVSKMATVLSAKFEDLCSDLLRCVT